VGDFVFVDEMGIRLDLAREDGRAAPGKRVVDTNLSTRGDTLSVIGALGADEVQAALSVPGAVEGDACLVFTTEGLVPCLQPGTLVFRDNVPTQKRPALAAAIIAVGARVQFLPAY
jgi:putative transposase